MACHDRYGLPLSTSSEAAAAAYREGVDLMFSAWPGAAEALRCARSPPIRILRWRISRAPGMHFIYADVTAAQARAATARELVARNGSAREKSHVETLALGMEGQSAKSLGLRARASRRMAARCDDLHPADGRVRPVRLLRHGRSRSGARRPVRALCRALRRRLVLPHLSRLVAHRERQRRSRPRHHPARVRGAARERQRGARAGARDVRGRLGRRCRAADHRTGCRPTTAPGCCTATSPGIRRWSRWSRAMRRARSRSMPSACSRR